MTDVAVTESHPSDEHVELYVLGRLSESDEAAVEEHLLLCESCRGRVQEADEYTAAMRAALEQQAERKSRTAVLYRWAAAAVVVFALWAFWPQARSGQPVVLALTAVRGDNVPQANAKAGLLLRLDTKGLEGTPIHTAQVVGAQGEQVYESPVADASDHVDVQLSQQLAPGQYYARLLGDGARVVREFSFQVQ